MDGFHVPHQHEWYTRKNSEKLIKQILWKPYAKKTFLGGLRAKKPVFLVISAPAWCHWCHVYESEDFLFHSSVYSYVNKNFTPIFIDSDKRPDLTKKYLEGGWPSTILFTPNYTRIIGFSGPMNPEELRALLEQIVASVRKREFFSFLKQEKTPAEQTRIPKVNEIITREEQFIRLAHTSFDDQYGGFITNESNMKFPTGLTYKYLLEKYEETNNSAVLNMVKKTLDNQYTDIYTIKTAYHLYDPVEGGFHRYSTQRDWSVPHYEKMLYDQAKLLRAYIHLWSITKDEKVKSVVRGTIRFVTEKLFDAKNGGFYSSQDAHFEENYYGKTEDERKILEPPFIDKTKNSVGNSLMINTLLDGFVRLNDTALKDMAEKTLVFIKENLVNKKSGVYYYFDADKKRACLQGLSLANAWGLLAFVDAYVFLGKKEYLGVAKKIAEFSLNELYDETEGGFFMWNSGDENAYAPNEISNYSKEYEENAVFAYSFLQLYLITKNEKYRDAGLKTLGCILGTNAGFDEMYYAVKAGELARKLL